MVKVDYAYSEAVVEGRNSKRACMEEEDQDHYAVVWQSFKFLNSDETLRISMLNKSMK